jgi:hypothetical protein
MSENAEQYGVSLGDDGKDTVVRGFCARNCGLSTLCRRLVVLAQFVLAHFKYSLRRARRIHEEAEAEH